MKLEEEEWSFFFLLASCCFCLLPLRIIPANIFISAIGVPTCNNILIYFVVSPQFTKPYCIPSETPALDNCCPYLEVQIQALHFFLRAPGYFLALQGFFSLSLSFGIFSLFYFLPLGLRGISYFLQFLHLGKLSAFFLPFLICI